MHFINLIVQKQAVSIGYIKKTLPEKTGNELGAPKLSSFGLQKIFPKDKDKAAMKLEIFKMLKLHYFALFSIFSKTATSAAANSNKRHIWEGNAFLRRIS